MRKNWPVRRADDLPWNGRSEEESAGQQLAHLVTCPLYAGKFRVGVRSQQDERMPTMLYYVRRSNEDRDVDLQCVVDSRTKIDVLRKDKKRFDIRSTATDLIDIAGDTYAARGVDHLLLNYPSRLLVQFAEEDMSPRCLDRFPVGVVVPVLTC
jgi:hypothetical protein